MKKFLCLITLMIGTSAFANKNETSSWRQKTRINLDTIYKTLRQTHPKASDSDFYLGRAYGLSLDKVKGVSSEEEFISVVADFGKILNHPSVEILSDKQLSLNDGKVKESFQLPFGGFLVTIR